MNNLVSTYRLQFHKGFNFESFEKLLPYWQNLGVSTIYASPIFKAVPGSAHGYDGLDPNRINPEIGTHEQLSAISLQLKAAGMSWLQDIVPNHMAFDSGNEWLMDVLEKGPQSHYSSFFDISWTSPLYHGRIMVPFLGASLEEVIERRELRIAWQNNRFVFQYFEASFPLQPLSYRDILHFKGADSPKVVADLLSRISFEEEEKAGGETWGGFGQQIAGLMQNTAVKDFVDDALESVNEDKELLLRIEQQQFYRLCHWQETDYKINYRRFFTVNGLICLNMQDETVFEQYHELTSSLLDEGVVQGLRIDHIDGLYDPTKYLHRLRQLAGEEVPLLVEKILEPGESLPKSWPVQGNTGYDFLSLANNLFTWKSSEKAFTKFYKSLVRSHRPLPEQIREKKAYILYNHMAGELENLYQLFRQSNIIDKKVFASIRPDDVKEAIGEFLVHCPVYRYYGTCFPLPDEEAASVERILNQVRYYNPELRQAVDLLDHVLLRKPHEHNKELSHKIAGFYQRCMQFSGPLMAKGVEDTLMYTYHRFAGHNEVGDSPLAFGISVAAFHHAMAERQHLWPLSLNATSTHDTKRGEDVRARLNVLTDLGDEWLAAVKSWMGENNALKKDKSPDANDEYLIYQTIVGALPMAGREADDFASRIQEYIQKALREAKMHSNWTSPNESYESAAREFAASVLHTSRPFPEKIQQLLSAIVDHGIINSLSQLVLKFTCPGIPDVYQGCELWDLSLVDPDNRRPVDYQKRIQLLAELKAAASVEDLWEDRRSGKVKLWLTQMLYTLRAQQPELFNKGEYLPLTVEGACKDHVLAFARKYRQQVLIIAVPLHTAVLSRDQGAGATEIDWKDTAIQLPAGVTGEWSHFFTEVELTPQRGLSVASLFSTWPFAIVKGQQLSSERGAGILLHISSLPSRFGIGDMGPEAKAFADFLQRGKQKYWQLLPLNPTEEGQGHSPYSSISSRAGNGLFISPELLVKDGLLAAAELQAYQLPQESRANYAGAEKNREELFEKAWKAYSRSENHPLTGDFESFQQKEKEWLDDFALYALLKQKHGGKPWHEWEDKLKLRTGKALEEVRKQHGEEILKIKWLQFIFFRQWHGLKTYCNGLGIQLIGDMPIYVSYDSADVWSHRHLFALDENGKRTGMAGVPPDAFSDDGQLWGMPVFNWEALKEQNYRWWIDRLRKNMEQFDIVRLDHFRAFSAYWEVPAEETTAKNGEWKQAPGHAFFEAVQNEFGELPFVAEDLGEIDAPVYELRDAFRLPGMKVLQFAFGGDMPRSVHIPHNYSDNFLVYTGTHDNNTTRGWFSREADEEVKKSVEKYTGRAVSADEASVLLARMAYGSVAGIVILPMQDVLNLDESARMNTPASSKNNWGWRLLPGQLSGPAEENLREWTGTYNRE